MTTDTTQHDPYSELDDDERTDPYDDGSCYEPDEPQEPRTWQRYEGWTRPDGSVMAFIATNDDRDLGYPNEFSSLTVKYPSVEHFRRSVGYTRVGMSGCEVTVTLDGEDQHPPQEMARRARVNDLAACLALELRAMLPEFEGATWEEVTAKLVHLSPGV
jgi:hypothetical protein